MTMVVSFCWEFSRVLLPGSVLIVTHCICKQLCCFQCSTWDILYPKDSYWCSLYISMSLLFLHYSLLSIKNYDNDNKSLVIVDVVYNCTNHFSTFLFVSFIFILLLFFLLLVPVLFIRFIFSRRVSFCFWNGFFFLSREDSFHFQVFFLFFFKAGFSLFLRLGLFLFADNFHFPDVSLFDHFPILLFLYGLRQIFS